MKNRHTHPALLTFTLLLATGCGDNQQPEAAIALYERIQQEGYQSFARAPGYETRKPSDAPHSDRVDIFINPVVADALSADEPLTNWPEGSLIVKDGYTDDGERELVAVMDKRSDGWFYAEYFDGDAKFSGKPDVCTDCHKSGADFVLAFGFP